MFKARRGKPVSIDFYVQQEHPSRMKVQYRHFQTDESRICRQQTCTTRNVKGSSLGRRKMITDRHINLHKRIKSGENATDGS